MPLRVGIFCAPAEKAGGSGILPNENLLAKKARVLLHTILSELKYNARPSLVGIIPGLHPEMEKAFRTGLINIVNDVRKGEDVYMLWGVFGGDTIIPPFWTAIGLGKDPTQAEKKQAEEAFELWKKHEVGFCQADKVVAEKAANMELENPYGIKILNAKSAGEIYYVIELLKLLPERILESGAIKFIDLNGGKDGDVRFGYYDAKNGGITIIDPYSIRDRHSNTVWLLHEIGHAVWQTLKIEQKTEFEQLYHQYLAEKALFVTDLTGISAQKRIPYLSLDEFFAENVMHFVIFGKNLLLNQALNQRLVHKLYRFYSLVLAE